MRTELRCDQLSRVMICLRAALERVVLTAGGELVGPHIKWETGAVKSMSDRDNPDSPQPALQPAWRAALAGYF